jgi:hypothetical protein
MKSRRMRCSGVCSTHGRENKCIQCLIGKVEGKRPVGRPRRRWYDNIRTDFREIRWEGVD